MKLAKIRNKIIPVLRKSDVRKAAFFGSFVRGEQTRESDLDILVDFKGQKSLFDLVRLKMNLEELLRMKVDVLTYNSLNPLLRDRILLEQEAIL